ncbi:MAG: 3-keto-5-aminohexanoate cleavage protein [Candidatus Omnitrophica bacterium]|nr:3-keto-5-aminohexanoate cleavage protein [Candidatus Omnitrophota bacterium]
MNGKLIIALTPTGMIPTKDMTPHVPVTPDEVVEDVLVGRQYGVSMVHLHARDDDGTPTYKRDVYAKMIEGIRKVDKDMILCVSTSGRNWPEFEKRSECLDLKGDLKPDMGSLTLSSLNFNKQASINTPQMIQDLAKKMMDNGIRPELEAFDLGMVNYAKYLHQKGLVKAPFYFNLILGNIACAQANILNLGLMVNELPPDSLWSAGGVGDTQLKMNINAMVNGGGVRVGIEDNIWMSPKRKELATNQKMVKRIHDIAVALEMDIATPSEARVYLGLEAR